MTSVWVSWQGPGVVGSITTDETKSVIRLVPPIEIGEKDDMTEFLNWVETYCEVAFLMHLDPVVIDASNWRDGLPAGL